MKYIEIVIYRIFDCIQRLFAVRQFRYIQKLRVQQLITVIKQIMGKKVGKLQKSIKSNSFKIAKSKSLQKNFDGYLQNLIKSNPDISYKQCAPLLHNFISKCIQTLNYFNPNQLVESANRIKICRKCSRWIKIKQQHIQCHSCQDNYHKNCVSSIEQFQTQQICGQCFETKKLKIEQKKQKQEQKQKKCIKCNKMQRLQNRKKAKLLQCIKCIRMFHLKCFGSEKGVCQQCEITIKQKLNQLKEKLLTTRQLTIKQSFKIKKTKKSSSIHSQLQQNCKQLEDTCCTLFTSRLLKQNYPQMEDDQIQKYRNNLLFAICAKNMEYVEQLRPIDCKISLNYDDSIDFGIAQLGTSDLRVYQKYKKQPIGPFIIVYKENMGYDVIADKDLPKSMLVCQYVGDVYSHRKSISMGYNDSRMELRRGVHADDNLFIIPTRYTNIARFINSLKPQDVHRLNLASTKCYIKGKPAVLLYTIKQIKKGESLFYDYNAGGATQGYDTSGYK